MNELLLFARLRNVLANLYKDETSSRVVVDDAMLDASKIAFSSRARTNWHAILGEAIQTAKTRALLAAALNDFAEVEELAAAVQAYDELVQKGGRLRPAHEPSQDHLALRNRKTMLNKVKHDWIEGVLERSLFREVLIELDLQERNNAVADPWRLIVQAPEKPDRILPKGTKVADVFEAMNQSLLVLGEPGSGKTTALLELARTLIEEAELDESRPIPVVFNLSQWTPDKQPFEQWLTDEMRNQYYIPKKTAAQWVEQDELLLLLDGLDEVEQGYRDACVKAVNQFRQEHIAPMAVCCRTAEYEALTVPVKLQGAVVLEPLDTPQIDEYLDLVAGERSELPRLLKHDSLLQELMQTPLMLSIAVLAYRDRPAEEVQAFTTVESRRNHLFATYVDSMFARRGRQSRFAKTQTLVWLTWLAQQMRDHMQTLFFVEGLQPVWLPAASRRTYRAASRLAGGALMTLTGCIAFILASAFFSLTGGGSFAFVSQLILGLVFGLAFGLNFGLANWLARWTPPEWAVALTAFLVATAATLFFALIAGRQPLQSLAAGLAGGLVFGIPGGLAGVSFQDRRPLEMAEALHWSLAKGMRGLAIGLAIGAGIGLIVGLVADGSGMGADVLAIGAPVGLVCLLAFGLSHSEVIETRTASNQGFRRSLKNALRVAAGVALASGLLAAPIGIFTGKWSHGLAYGVGFGLPISLSVGLLVGGAACIQHMTLRLIMYSNGHLALDCVRFLDYAAERILLRKVGGGHIFVHRLLLDYFASGAAPDDLKRTQT